MKKIKKIKIKNPEQIKLLKTHIVYNLLIINLFIYFIAINSWQEIISDLKKIPVIPAQAQNIEKPVEMTMREWVLNEVKEAGLDLEEVDCLIKNESGWNNWAYNVNWNGNTTDMGLWQINSCHKGTISVEDRFDWKKSTKWAIQKRLQDGNWDAWYGYKNNCK